MNWADLFLKFLPLVLPTVVAVQGAIPGAPPQTKKKIALDLILAGAHVAEAIPEAHVAAAASLIDVVVGSLKSNSTAGFTPSKGGTAPAVITKPTVVTFPTVSVPGGLGGASSGAAGGFTPSTTA